MCAKALLKLKNIRMKNTLSALNTLRISGTLSRVELAEKMHCDGTAVTRITRDLIGRGVLRTAGMAESKGGRPRERIELNAGWRNAIGIELAPRGITGVLVDLRGKIIVREQIFLSGELTRKEFVDALEMIARRLLDACERAKLLGVGVATFGPFSSEGKILESVAAYPALDKFDIGSFFAEEFGIVPEIADATFARALYEIWFNNTGAKGNFLLFNAGDGIGCATAIDGKIVFSKHSNTGEFGHTIYKLDGDLCACGRRGCLETLCAIGAVERKARERKSGGHLKFADIADDYASGNGEFADIVADCARWLGVAIANQINFLIPDDVVVTGEILRLGDAFFQEVLDTIKEYTFPAFMKNVTIQKSDSWDESAPLGAASLLVRKVFEEIEQ